MTNEATIKISRRWSLLFGGFLSLGIFVDNKKIGTIANGMAEAFLIPAGEHSIFLDGGFWTKTKTINVALAPGDRKSFKCGITPGFMGWQLGAPVLMVIIAVILLFVLPGGIWLDPKRLQYAIYIIATTAAVCTGIMGFSYILKPGGVYYLKEVQDYE